ncbi:unnamed protein product [Lepeophtheirus salmonis]|uniref:(salmon louse) hypothetical protein n=1 Tax=Lepeophtheirus salmonis TaxID=72036 RepID=A0A7R8HCB9_LEPSM|nr:unnamed protein product [Lepeophtheirus salmonis]CAF3005029.1 unnamed protein product [Lepeophtheirus salmonis]
MYIGAKLMVHVNDEFIIRIADRKFRGIKGSVRVLKVQQRDEDGNRIVFEKNILIHFPYEDITTSDIEDAVKNILVPDKECCFQDGKLPGFLLIKGSKTRISHARHAVSNVIFWAPCEELPQ